MRALAKKILSIRDVKLIAKAEGFNGFVNDVISINVNSSDEILLKVSLIKKLNNTYLASISKNDARFDFGEDVWRSLILSIFANIQKFDNSDYFDVRFSMPLEIPNEVMLEFCKKLKNKNIFSVEFVANRQLVNFKKFLYDQTIHAPKVGKGFIVNIDNRNNDVEILNREYNDIAWGKTNWANHQTIADDEMGIIKRYIAGNVLEIGAGTGRVTKELVKVSSALTVTDYLDSLVDLLGKRFINLPKVDVIKDDISNSKLADEKFDKVCFFENGLGNLIHSGLRKLAVRNMVRLAKPKGSVILAVRVSEPSGDQLMIASIDPSFMGIYHTFSVEEIHDLFSEFEGRLTIVAGSERLAGGKEIFAIFEKV